MLLNLQKYKICKHLIRPYKVPNIGYFVIAKEQDCAGTTYHCLQEKKESFLISWMIRKSNYLLLQPQLILPFFWHWLPSRVRI